MLKEFREFAMKGNVVDMAVGIVIGAAFGAIVNSLVTDIDDADHRPRRPAASISPTAIALLKDGMPPARI